MARAPNASCDAAGAAEHGDQRRAAGAGRARRGRLDRRAAPTPAPAGPTAATTRRRRRSTNAATSRATYSHRVRASPSRTASVRLPAAVSDGMSRRLLTTSSAHARHPAAHPITHRQPGHPLDGDVRRADRRHEPEEHEHEQLAEPGVAVRPRARRCRTTPRRSPPRRRRAATTTSSRRAPGRRRRRRRTPANAARFTARRRLQPGRDEAHRPDPRVVGAADAVAVVVGVVHADLQGQADDEGDGDPPPHHRSGADRAPGADGDGHDGGGQRARPGAEDPGVHAVTMPHTVAGSGCRSL